MSITYRLIGVTGAEIDLSDPASPIRLRTDPEGLDGPERQAAMQENVNQGGAYYKGQQDMPNKISFDYRFGGGTEPIGKGDPAIAEAIRWRRALGTGRSLAEFHVIDDDAGTDRWEYVRNTDKFAGVPLSVARSIGHWNQGKLSLYSDSSYWTSEPIDVTYLSGDLTGHTITNLGDFDGWFQAEIVGPTVGLKIGLDGEEIALANISSGHTYTIETDPTCPLIHLDGADAWETAAGVQSFRKSAPAKAEDGTITAVPITIVGTAASVRIVLPQVHWAATG